MKIKNIIILFICCMFISGCEATYTIDLDDNFLEETIINSSNNNDQNSMLSASKNIPAFSSDTFDPEDTSRYDDVEYYNITSNNNALYLNYRFKDKYELSNVALTCFPSFLYIEGKYLRINTLSDMDCFNKYPSLDKITINVKTTKEVSKHNADYVNGNVYTWVYDKDNGGKAINIEVLNPNYEEKDDIDIDPIDTNNDKKDDKKESKETNKETSSGENDNLYIFLLTGLFFILLFVIIFFRNKFKNL